MPSAENQINEFRRNARAHAARRMVDQGLTLYYQSLVHRVHEETPAFVDRVLVRAECSAQPRTNGRAKGQR